MYVILVDYFKAPRASSSLIPAHQFTSKRHPFACWSIYHITFLPLCLHLSDLGSHLREI